MRTKKTKLDEIIFKQIEEMEFTEQEGKIVMKHLYAIIIDIKNDRRNIDQAMNKLKGVLVSCNNLKKSKLK